jgi:hypothetical protein
LVLDGAYIAGDGDVITADFSVIGYPMGHRRATANIDLILAKTKKDRIANHVPFGVTANNLLGFAGTESGKAIDGKTRSAAELNADVSFDICGLELPYSL